MAKYVLSSHKTLDSIPSIPHKNKQTNKFGQYKQNVYPKNLKTLLKEIREGPNKWRDVHAHGLDDPVSYNVSTSQTVKIILIKMPEGFYLDIDKLINEVIFHCKGSAIVILFLKWEQSLRTNSMGKGES